MQKYLGLDIGGTKLAVSAADETGRIVHKTAQPTDAKRGPEPILRDAVQMLRNAGADAKNAPIGVSFGGPYDIQTGRVGAVPNLPGWDGLQLQKRLENAFPNRTLAMDNDANASALAEWKLGGGRGYQNIVYLTMGTGIGAGVIVNGRLMRGANNAAGEIGHICLIPDGPKCGCGKRGCFEALCSGPAIARRAREKIALGEPDDGLLRSETLDELTTVHIVEAAKNGNRFALTHLEETAFYAAWGVASIANIVNPEIVLLGTIAVAAGDLLLEPLRRALSRFVFPAVGRRMRVEPAGLGELVGDHAAVALVFQPETEAATHSK